MEPQTQTQIQAGASGASSLDPQAVNLAKAIRQSESGGNFTASGKSGEYGAYQYTEPTWAKDSAAAGVSVPLKQATPEQQNQVAYTKIKALKDQGLNVGQIASTWNAGAGEPDAYTGKFSDGSPSVGTNKYGVKFDVPAYAKSVASAYQTLKGGGQVSADPNNPSSTAAPQTQDQSPSVGGFLGNVVGSAANLAGGIGNAIMHPIDTVAGIANIGAGALERGVGAITGNQPQTNEAKTFDNVVNFYGQRYGGSSIEEVAKNILHSAYTDPVGVAADASVLLSGGAAIAGKVGATADLTEAMRIANAGGSIADMAAVQGTSAASKIASGLNVASEYTNPISLATKGASGLVGLTRKGASTALGMSTGVGSEPINQGFSAVTEGGDARQAFLRGLRGKTSPEDLVAQAKDASAQVVAERNANYQSMLKNLGKDSATYDISPIGTELQNQLKKFNIGVGADGSLDFSRSKFALDTTAQRDIENLNNFISKYGTKAGDRTALGVDNLKQVLAGYYSPNSDYRAFTQGLKSATRKVLDDAPGYTEEMKNYSALTDQIQETNKALSLGDKASVDTAFRKLTSSLKNNDTRLQIIKELDQATGGNLLASIAGQRLSSVVPRGITAALETAGGGLGIATLGAGGILPLLTMAMTTSPRLVGEFVNALGIGSRGAAKVMELLNKARIPLTVAGTSNGLVNLQSSQ